MGNIRKRGVHARNWYAQTWTTRKLPVSIYGVENPCLKQGNWAERSQTPEFKVTEIIQVGMSVQQPSLTLPMTMLTQGILNFSAT